jgi:hypothetical protein
MLNLFLSAPYSWTPLENLEELADSSDLYYDPESSHFMTDGQDADLQVSTKSSDLLQLTELDEVTQNIAFKFFL